MTNPDPVAPPPLTTSARGRPRLRASPVAGAFLAALGFGALHFLRNPTPEPARVAPYAVDPARAPWYILAAVDGVGARTARRWTEFRDGAAAAGIRVSPQDWPGMGPASLARLAALPSAPSEPPR